MSYPPHQPTFKQPSPPSRPPPSPQPTPPPSSSVGCIIHTPTTRRLYTTPTPPTNHRSMTPHYRRHPHTIIIIHTAAHHLVTMAAIAETTSTSRCRHDSRCVATIFTPPSPPRPSRCCKRKGVCVVLLTTNRASDEELEAPMEDQPLPADASPTALSPGYIADSDPEEDEEDPADHPADGGDNDDNESSDDDDMIMSPQAEDIEAFETNESASTPPTSLHHFAVALPSSLPPSVSPPPENIKSLKDNIKG
ncbi:hypothetical protein Tco_0691115 [Tanacetum coccineum]